MTTYGGNEVNSRHSNLGTRCINQDTVLVVVIRLRAGRLKNRGLIPGIEMIIKDYNNVCSIKN